METTTVKAGLASASVVGANVPDSKRVALVRTAVPLSTEQKGMILERLRARYGAEVQGQFELDPSLLGGVQARVGDQLIDDSVAGRLEALRDALMKSGETK